jgi:hypothetical protein
MGFVALGWVDYVARAGNSGRNHGNPKISLKHRKKD